MIFGDSGPDSLSHTSAGSADCHRQPARSWIGVMLGTPRNAKMPIANRLQEARLVIETARKTKVATHFLPASDGASIREIKAWIDAGAIGKLREIHNWSNRPVWPQYATRAEE